MNPERLKIELEEEGHIAFSDSYSYNRFKNSLSDCEKEKLIFVEKDWSVFVKDVV